MYVEQQVKRGKIQHSIHMDNRERIVITGITDVSSFDEMEVVLFIDEIRLVLHGENLHIGILSLEEGRLDIRGRIDGITYEKLNVAKRFLMGKKK